MELVSAASRQKLCSPCQQMAITLENQSENRGIPLGGKALLSLGKGSRKISCDLCRYFLSLSPSYSCNNKLHVRLFDRFDVARFEPKQALARNLAHIGTPFLSVLREHTRMHYDFSVQEEIFAGGVVVHVPTEYGRSISCTLHFIEESTADWGCMVLGLATVRPHTPCAGWEGIDKLGCRTYILSIAFKQRWFEQA